METGWDGMGNIRTRPHVLEQIFSMSCDRTTGSLSAKSNGLILWRAGAASGHLVRIRQSADYNSAGRTDWKVCVSVIIAFRTAK